MQRDHTALACPNFLIWSNNFDFDGNDSEHTLHLWPVYFYLAAFFYLFSLAFPFFLLSSSSFSDSDDDFSITTYFFWFFCFLFFLVFSLFSFFLSSSCILWLCFELLFAPKACIKASVSSPESESETILLGFCSDSESESDLLCLPFLLFFLLLLWVFLTSSCFMGYYFFIISSFYSISSEKSSNPLFFFLFFFFFFFGS